MELPTFLADHERAVRWSTGASDTVKPQLVFLGRGDHALEVALASADIVGRTPTMSAASGSCGTGTGPALSWSWFPIPVLGPRP